VCFSCDVGLRVKGGLSWHVIMSYKAAPRRDICLREKFSPYRRGEVPLIYSYSGAIHDRRGWTPSHEKRSASHFKSCASKLY